MVTIPILSVPPVNLEFPHHAPQGYSYEFEESKRNTVAIWLRHSAVYDYNLGKSVRTIWGFFNTKTKSYHLPINSSTVGGVVDIESTTPYSAMILKQTPLESAFV
jgi:hypothetical protein